MERYRLIVAANDILSNPDKRRAYDRTGAGWNGRMEHGLHPSRYNWSHTSGETRWSGFDTNDSPFQNATWEDWERWYNRHKKAEPIYVSNGGFVSLVVVALVLGAFGQSGQVSRHTALFKEQVEMKHENASNMMLRHKADTQRAVDRDQRLQEFLKTRDEGVLGLGMTREEPPRMLAEPVVCISDEPQSRSGKGKDSIDGRTVGGSSSTELE